MPVAELMKVERSAKRVRVMLGREVVADSRRPLLVWEKPFYPTYYFPAADVRTDLMVDTGVRFDSSGRGQAQVFTVKTGEREAPQAAFRYPDSPAEEIREAVAFEWQAMDHWFEEDEEVYVHARDPYTRIDILHSSRWVRIEIDGVKVAETRSPTLLFETGLPTRYYIPNTDVWLELLTPTDRATDCPYKGTAQYWSLDVNGIHHDNIVWSYKVTTPESAKIAGLMCFYSERVDTYVDGELEGRPIMSFR